MLLGLLADIHEAVDPLRAALADFRNRGVDRVVTLGDACDMYGAGGRAPEVAALLAAAGAVGVWGNHDVGLCYDVPDRIRREVPEATLAFMASLHPSLVIEGCRITHVEPWIDGRKIEDLWYFDGPPDSAAKAARSFAAVPERFLFCGHFHRWLVVTPDGPLPWTGEGDLSLAGAARALVVVGPVVGGWCGVFDTASALLTPVRCGG